MNADDYVNKRYKVDVTFNVSGLVPPRFSIEDLKSAIKGHLSELEQDSELYDAEEYYVWATFTQDFNFDITEYEVDFVEVITCYHCGVMSDYYGARIYEKNSGIEWCQDCGEHYLSESEKSWVKKEGKKFKKKLIKKKIKALQDELNDL